MLLTPATPAPGRGYSCGTAPPTPLVPYGLLQQDIDQWTNVFGISQTPTSTDTPQSGWTRTRYADSSGNVDVEAYSIQGAGHVLPETGMAAYAIHFFGLDSASPTPTPTSTPSPTPTTTSSGTACAVTYTPDNWQGGFTANITISNASSTTVNGWTLGFTFPGDEKITNAWNATISQSGEAVTATNVSYNATISPGATTSLGFQGTWTSSDSPPSTFTLNGQPCTTG